MPTTTEEIQDTRNKKQKQFIDRLKVLEAEEGQTRLARYNLLYSNRLRMMSWEWQWRDLYNSALADLEETQFTPPHLHPDSLLGLTIMELVDSTMKDEELQGERSTYCVETLPESLAWQYNYMLSVHSRYMIAVPRHSHA